MTNFEHQDLEKALRVGVNATIQSVSSDGMLIAVCGLQDEIEEKNLPMLIFNVIHDAVYVQIRQDFVKEGTEVILRHLSKWPENLVSPFTGKPITPQIPMVADSEIGESWDTLKEIEHVDLEDEDDEEEEED